MAVFLDLFSGEILNLNMTDYSGDVVGPGSAVDNNFLTFNGTDGKLVKDSGYSFIDDDTMASASAVTIPSAESVKAYIDSAVVSQVAFKGSYNASTDSPDLSAGTGIGIGWMYVVTVAGNAGGFWTTALEVGDVVIAEQDAPTLESHYTVVNKDLDAASIKTSYESNADTNAFTDAEQTKLSGITTAAEVNTASNIGAGAELFKQKTVSDLEFRTFDPDWAVVSSDTITKTTAQHEIEHLSDGAILGPVTFVFTEAGGVVTCTVDNATTPGLDLEAWASDHAHTLTLAATVDTNGTLTVGSDVSPSLNYVYFLASTDVLTASTSGWPVAEHFRVGTVLLQSAASVGTDQPYKVHKWTDQPSNGGGHIVHINEWIRNQPATWKSGIVTTITGSGTATVSVSTTAGVVYQLHEHTMPAFADPSPVYVTNFFGTAYKKITDLTDIIVDSANVTLNNKDFALVLWGAVSEATGECKLFINVPAGGYNNLSDVRLDPNKYTNYAIPDEFKGIGFLIRRLVFVESGTFVFTLDDDTSDDLRGLSPNSAPGSAVGTSTVFADNAFRIQDDGDVTKELDFQLSGATTATKTTLTASQTVNRTLTLPDATDTLVGKATTDTLTNKTLAATTLSGKLSCADQDIERAIFTDYGETVNIIGSTGGGTQDIDLTLGNVVSATVDTSANTFTFSNPTATGNGCGFVLYLTNGGSQTVNWPASVDFAGGVAPTLTAAGVDVLVFTTIDAGTIWHGNLAIADSK